MPELPAVERARRLIHDNVLNGTITKVTSVGNPTVDDIVFMGTTNVEFAEKVTGAKIIDTGRMGKVFYIILDRPTCPVLHLGMTGSVRLKGQEGLKYEDFSTECEFWPPKYYKFVLHFADGQELAFTDARRLARIRVVEGDPLTQPPISLLGFDPILSMPPLEVFKEGVKRRKCPVKALILDQSFSAGVGNWIADEVLFQARIHPAQYTNSLTDAEIEALHAQIPFVCQTAVDVNADGKKFPKDWLYHFRWGKGKLANRTKQMPDGSVIDFITVGGRTSAYVPSVQQLHEGDGGSTSSPKKKLARKRKKALQSSSDEAEDSKADLAADSAEEKYETKLAPPAKKRSRTLTPATTAQSEAPTIATSTALRRSTRVKVLSIKDEDEPVPVLKRAATRKKETVAAPSIEKPAAVKSEVGQRPARTRNSPRRQVVRSE
ncbi:DNA glycosylase/AP lyase [Phlyctochytrium arcticum]|nr:DNA glycosylase/AP lyase [Phlyctochytrium arcticum]